MHIGQFVLSWTANLSFSRDEQLRLHHRESIGKDREFGEIVANRSINGSNRTSGMVGINS